MMCSGQFEKLYESICENLDTFAVLCSQESCGLDFGAQAGSVPLGSKSSRPDRCFFDRSRWLSFLLPQLTRGETGFFIWIVTFRNGFGEVLVSCWLSPLPHSLWTTLPLFTLSCIELRTAGIPLNLRSPKCSRGLPLPGGMHVSSTVAAIQNDISSKRLPLSKHALFVYTWITHHSSCLSVTTAPTVEPCTDCTVYRTGMTI